jgi:hypothetical protein
MDWAQFINEDSCDFVILKDRSGEEFVGLGEIRGMFSPPAVRNAKFSLEPSMIRVLITGVCQWKTVLPKPVTDGFGRVICRTIREAYETKAEVW